MTAVTTILSPAGKFCLYKIKLGSGNNGFMVFLRIILGDFAVVGLSLLLQEVRTLFPPHISVLSKHFNKIGIISSMLFGGSLMCNYFCGWYYRCQSEQQTLAVIPSGHRTRESKFCAIQMITDKEPRSCCFCGYNDTQWYR